jgi:long-chain acyl-CoA synthetase
LRAGIDANLADDTDMRNRFEAARALGAEVLASGRSVGRGLPAELAERWGKAQQEVIRPVLARFGLDEVKIAMTGSAAMAQSTAEFFLHCGIPLSDLYGQSETSGLVSWDPNEITPGTSGKPLPGVKVTLADDGEILVRGDNVFVGYLNDESSTSEVMDGAGWLHTGDLGRIDEEGNLVLVGRKKDLLVPSNGHNVSPAPIEAALKECLLIGQACVIGDARPYLVALVVLDPQAVTSWAQRFGFHESTLTELSEEPALIGALEQHVKETNRRFAPAERIREFVMLAEQWPLDSELLTPTGKLKRRGILLRYEDLIAEMYRR